MAGSQFFTMPLGWDKGSQQLLGGGLARDWRAWNREDVSAEESGDQRAGRWGSDS